MKRFLFFFNLGVLAKCFAYYPMVFAGEINRFKREVARRDHFLIHYGHEYKIKPEIDEVKSLFQMIIESSLILSWGLDQKVVRVGRMQVLDRYLDNLEVTNAVRSFAKSGELDLKYFEYPFLKKCLHFIDHSGVTTNQFREPEFFLSHLVDSQSYLDLNIKKEAKTGDYYYCGSHFLWLDQFWSDNLIRLKNPIGLLVNHDTDLDRLKDKIDILNPLNEPGKIIIIIQLGAQLLMRFEEIIHGLKKYNIKYICNPSQVFEFRDAKKGLLYSELQMNAIKFFYLCREHELSCGLHLDTTPGSSIECLGVNSSYKDLDGSHFRLNKNQTIELSGYLSNLKNMIR